ncbi:MAG TPA: hypothetical protein VGA21_03400 [Cyclobacteriaceae bacterium]|jgi:hypothetical protein
MKKSINILILLVLISCQVQEKLETNPGTIKFSMQSVVRNEGGRITETPTPASVLISIEDESGNTVEDNKKLTLYSLGQGFVSESLQLIPGSYKLTQFLILNEDDGVIYATPQEGSELAEFVNDPLPIEFTISEDENTLVTPQVLAVHPEDTPESFGFASFGFEVVAPRLKKVIYTSIFGIHIRHFSYNGELLAEIAEKGCQTCSSGNFEYYGSVNFEYSPDKKLIKRTYVNKYGVVTPYFINEYSGGLLVKRKIFGPSYEYEQQYTYDSNTHLISMTESTGRLHEFELSLESDKLIDKLFLNFQIPESLRFITEFSFDGKRATAFPITGSEEIIDIYGYPIGQNVIGIRQKDLNTITGEVNYECYASIQYEYNSLGLPVKATVSNPDGCIFEIEDGTVIEFFYE